MKVNSYKLSMTENGNTKLSVIANNEEIEVCELEGTQGLTAGEITERALIELKNRDFEIIPKEETLEYLAMDQKSDLGLVRIKMRQILKDLSNPEVPIKTKQEALPIIQQTCSASQIIVNACKLELALYKEMDNARKTLRTRRK